ncbi:ADP-ribosylation/crystallin J1 [Bradyrhizobium liaoningense]|uniref:ADP-ribosylation/crystallin J1 n=1 Tax=Bradyrhizobium liaoningense TaxID=43992 RepID=UPI001BAB6B2A|nr:ADP-ribosylation/crystallin J1 [Bradyrhizobium liaoningense]MBR0843956.1 ADP-ribosylation/crystallin J1 [Bradyrhizobium liaoningense]
MSLTEDTLTLWRPVGPKELELIQQTGMRAFPPRLPDQPIFYPVLTEDYAIKIARDWNVQASGSGFVTRFEVKRDFIAKYEVQEAGGREHLEYWIPAEELDAFNAAIVGLIEVVRSFP